MAANARMPIVTVTMAKSGAILDDKTFRAMDARTAISNAQIQAPPIRKFETLNGTRGFTLLGGVGPGGTGYVALAKTADGTRDIAMSITFSGRSSKDQALTESNNENTANMDETTMLKWLAECFPKFAEEVARLQRRGNGKPDDQLKAGTSNSSSRVKQGTTSQVIVTSGSISPASGIRNRFFALICIVSMSLLITFIIAKRFRR